VTIQERFRGPDGTLFSGFLHVQPGSRPAIEPTSSVAAGGRQPTEIAA